MRLLRLEMKRIIKSKRTLILLAAALVLSVVMVWIPVIFVNANQPNADGSITELSGLQAIRFLRKYNLDFDGDVTQEKVAEALRTYQDFVNQYGTLETGGYPLDEYFEKIYPIYPITRGLNEIYADPSIGTAIGLMEIDPDDVLQNYYERCALHLNDIMQLEQKQHPAAQENAAALYEKVSKPFTFAKGITRDAFDYTVFYTFFLVILCVAIAAPVFSGEYQSGADSILRCAKFVKAKLAITKIVAYCLIFMVVYALGMAIHLLIMDAAFGFDRLKESFQLLYTIIALPDLNLGQTQIVCALYGLISLLACVGCTMLISARCKEPLTVMIISIVVMLLPIFAYFGLGENWVSVLLPSGGLGLQNSILYQLLDFKFLHIGGISIWTPYLLFASALIEIPIFPFLAVRSYIKHQVT